MSKHRPSDLHSRPPALYTTRRYLRSAAWLLASTALTSPFLSAQAIAQTPTGGSVAAGTVTITQPNATTVNVTQSSQSAVVNYQSFSVGQGSSVNFIQPNASSAILNRVTSSAPSTIAGQINGNGQVYLVNPNGIAITKSGTVNVGGGFVASTLGISDSDFMAGKRTFTGNGSSSSVSNAGTISVGRGGYAALIGGTVSNAGSINVPLGKVALGSAERATLDFSGDGFLQVAVPTATTSKRALIRNSGTIKADGGSVILSAATAREAARNAINISGTIQARSIGGRSGSIVIGGGGGGRVRITGRLIATSRQSTGGRIVVTGQSIKLKGATIDASGQRGGGTINIGGGRQGQGPLQRAETVSIDSKTKINADARESGNGGNVVVWSDLLTTFVGTISAKGGAVFGNGGDAEVSGKTYLDYTGTTDLRAPNGITGTLLLDPYNVIISNGTLTTDANFNANANDSVINATTLNNALQTASVTVTTGDVNSAGTQAGTITVNAPISWLSNTLLTLNAANAIAVNASITINGGGQLALNTATTSVNVQSAQPLLSFGGGASVTFASGQTGQALTVNGNSYALVRDMATLANIDGSSMRYALATDLTSSSTYTAAVINSFAGTLEGLGHTISNLTINSASIGSVGLIGTLAPGGTLRDLGMVGGSVSGGYSAGGLAGTNYGTVTRAYATGAVSGASHVGGLVGRNLSGGSILQVYATGSVSGPTTANIGGLVGLNLIGSITQAYATGAVSGGNANVGGLVGDNNGYGGGYTAITQSYATGTVRGSGDVGGLVGMTENGASVTNSYWNTATSGLPSSSGGTGVATAELASGTTLAALGGAAVWGNGGNKTTPYLLNNLGPVLLGSGTSATPMVYTPITTQAQLEAVNNNNSANYVLVNNLDLGGTTYTGAVIGSFSGTLNGLGNTIANLTINASSSNYAGLIGQLGGGTARNIGLVGGSISGGSYVGGLVGFSSGGTISQVFATGTVSGSGNFVGGLAGLNGGSITQSYATGAVSGNTYVGGLAGANGTSGSITQSYATGAVSGSSFAGGLVGNQYGTVSQSYWNTQTSGYANGVGSGDASAITGLTTGQFQGTEIFAGAVSLGNAFSGGVADPTRMSAGLYPYLKAFYPTTPQAISGFAYSDRGVTPLASGANGTQNVFVTIAGTQTAVSTGANGYYYTLVPSGTLAAPGTATLAYTTGNNAATGTVTSATLIAATGTTKYLDVWGNTLIAPTASATLSAAPTTGATLFASNNNATLFNAATGSNAALATSTGNLAGTGYIATSTQGFTIDSAIGSGASTGGLYVRTTQGPLTVSTAQALTGPTNLSLYSGGTLAINANIAVNGAGLVSLDAGSRAITIGQNNVYATTLDMSFGNGASIDYGATDQGGRLTISGSAYTLLYGLASNGSNAVQDIDTLGFFGNYALATNLTGTQTFTSALLGNTNFGFYGTLEGLGHTISNLTIASSNANIGLVGVLAGGGGFSGTIRNLGLIGGSVTALTPAGGTTQYVGGIVGISFGTVTQVYSSATVNGDGNVGGLVGELYTGSLTRSYATGAVNGAQYVGGLAGFMYGGLIGQSYATGAVSGQAGVGGLVGVASNGAIDQSYASGAITASVVGGAGGIAGFSLGQVTNSYWDMQTSGQSVGLGGSPNAPQTGVTGLATQDFQSGLATGLGSAFSSATGLYPYLTNFFPGGVRAVSGFAYTDAGTTPLTSGANGGALVSVLASGNAFGSVSTGANGYYYAFGAAGSISNGSSLVAYTQANNATGANDAVTYTVATANPNNTGVNVYGGWKLDRPASTIAFLTELNAFERSAAGSSPAAAFSLANRDIRIAASDFTFNNPIALTGTLAIDGTGTVTQTNSSFISAGALRLSGSGGAFTLTSAGNAVSQIAADTGSVSLVDSVALTTGSIGNASGTTIAGVTTSGAVSLATTGDLTLASGAAVNGTSPVLSTGGVFTNNAGSAGIVAANATRFLVYSQNPAVDFVNNLAYDFKQYNAPLGTTPAQTTGNGLLYARPQTATLGATGILDKTYDKTATTRLLTGVGLSIVSGGVTGDQILAVAGATGAFNSVNAGTNIPVSIDSSAVTFVDAAGRPVYGYQVASNITGNITPKLLSIDLSVASKIYDGTGTANYVLSSRDVLAGDVVTYTPAQAPIFGNRNVGNYTLQATNISVGGRDGANYAVSNSGAQARASITRRQLTITADAQSRVYGEANPALTYTFGGMGLANNETVGGALATIATPASNAGVYAITQNTLATQGGTFRESNYTITYVGANLTVTQRALTVTANAQSRIYGDGNPALTFQTTGLVNGDALTGALATIATTTSNVGGYAINQGSLANANYNITYNGANLSVTQRSLTVTANAQSRIYGDANPALTYQVAGLVNGDGLTGALATVATTTSNVGGYAITQGALSASTNYVLTYNSANLSVTPRALTISANAQSRIYGDANPTLTYQLGEGGLVNGDALTGALTTIATATSGVGAYAIDQGSLANANYNISFTGANLSVTARALTITANAQSHIYGDANPALSYTLGGGGLVNGDALTGTLATSAAATSGVGNYAINQGSLAASANYAVSYTGASLAVAAAPIIVTAIGGTSIEGTAPVNPGLSATGLRNGDAVATLTGLGNSFAINNTSSAANSPFTLNVIGTLTNPNYWVVQRIAGQWIVTAAPVQAAAPPVDLSAIASSVVNDNFYPAALPNTATPVFGAPPILTSLGTGTLFTDPRFSTAYVCFGAGQGLAASCFAVGL